IECSTQAARGDGCGPSRAPKGPGRTRGGAEAGCGRAAQKGEVQKCFGRGHFGLRHVPVLEPRTGTKENRRAENKNRREENNSARDEKCSARDEKCSARAEGTCGGDT